MVNQNTPGRSLRARQIPQAIRFLRKLDVPATRLAGILGESADNIRHIDNRAYTDAPAEPDPIGFDREDLALLRLSPGAREAQFRRNLQGIRLRSKQDLDQVEASVWAIFRSHQSIGLEKGYDTLLAMLPAVANARHGAALSVRLLIEEKLAWFALPLNRIEIALGHAKRTMSLAVEAFRESAGTKSYLLRYGEAALVASICHQKLHRPKRAIGFIRLADDANIAAGQLPGSEHLRQRGASFIHLGQAREQIKAMREQALARPSSQTDILGALDAARQELSLFPKMNDRRLLIVSDFLEDDGTYNFVSAPLLDSPVRARLLAARLREQRGFTLPDVRLCLGRLESSDFRPLSAQRKGAVQAFWSAYLSGTRNVAEIRLDGTEMLADPEQGCLGVER